VGPDRVAFWIALAVGYLLLTPQAPGQRRQRTFAIINLGALLFLLGSPALMWFLLCLTGYRLLLSKIQEKVEKDLEVAPLAAAGALALLLVAAGSLQLVILANGPQTHLLLLGFSYLILRLVYLTRGVVEGRHPAPGLLQIVSYLAPFHMLAAGPIQTYEEFLKSDQGAPDSEGLMSGVERISNGLFKKFVLAETIRVMFLTDFSHPDPAYFLLEVQLNFVWLYLDFSGYSDIAVGAGRLMGLGVPENFHRPLLSRNLIEFWERWHITLSRFIKTQVFLPMQFFLMRGAFATRPLQAAIISFLTAFVLCGLWHKVSVAFLFWGLLHGIGLGCCKIFQTYNLRAFGAKAIRARSQRPLVGLVSIVLTMEFVAFSWLIVTLPASSPWYPSW
jgi:D-alanyl-lipoteichoic acid acyltransferase DltB (MBOAT superfamily)